MTNVTNLRMFTEEITLVTRGTPTGDYDLDGKPIYGPDRRDRVPAWYEPRTGSENVDAKDQNVWGYWVYVPLNTDMSAFDHIEIDGLAYDVDGEPGRQPGGVLVEGYILFAAMRTTG